MSYACLWCGREIEGESLDDGSWMFVHDDIPHPADATYDEDDRPQ